MDKRVGLGYTAKHDQEHLHTNNKDYALINGIKDYFKSELRAQDRSINNLLIDEGIETAMHGTETIEESANEVVNEATVVSESISTKDKALCIEAYCLDEKGKLTSDSWEILNGMRTRDEQVSGPYSLAEEKVYDMVDGDLCNTTKFKHRFEDVEC